MGTTSWKRALSQLVRVWEADPAVCSYKEPSSVCLPCRNCSFGNPAGLGGQWNRADQRWVSPSFQWARGGRSSVPADERDGSVWWDGSCCHFLSLLSPSPKISKTTTSALRDMLAALRKHLSCVWESSSLSSENSLYLFQTNTTLMVKHF